MRRAASITALLVLLLAPSAARAGDAPRLRATVSSCQTGIDPASRSAVFTASMPGNEDTARMAIRFDLQQRTVDGGIWKKVAAPSFGRWERSRPGVAGFVYAKDVHGLTAPGEYRAVVRFRWYASDGTRLGDAQDDPQLQAARPAARPRRRPGAGRARRGRHAPPIASRCATPGAPRRARSRSR